MTIALKKSPLWAAISGGVGSLVAHIRLNSIFNHTHNGRPVIRKRRNPFGRYITPLANLFFRHSRASIRFWTNTRDWQDWEVECFRMLNPRYNADVEDAHTIREAQLPGENLWVHLKRGTLTRHMLIAAAHEFRRAHQMWSRVHEDLWSHGDGAMRNVLYDPQTGRARLIDFELFHETHLPARTRHADDLLSFLLDLVGYIPKDRWMPWAITFLKAYGNRAVLRELQRQLSPPRGIARLWWRIRTNFVDAGKILPRLHELQAVLEKRLLPPVTPAAVSSV